MRKNLFLYGAMAAGLLFTGCQSDNQIPDPDQSDSQTDKVYYLNVSIGGDVTSGTRATADANGGTPTDPQDFDKGNGESGVTNAYFLFYDANGKPVGEPVPVALTNENLTEITATDGSSNTVEKYYKSVIGIKVGMGESTPSQMICLINPISTDDLNGKNLKEVETLQRKDLQKNVDGKKYFAMSNSVYYPNKNAGTFPQTSVQIKNSQLYPTKEGASANSAEVVEVYVERYAAKVKFSVADNTSDTDPTIKPYVTATSMVADETEIPVALTFNVGKWVLNASCVNSWVVKSFRKEGADGTMLSDNYTYDGLNAMINATSYSATGTTVTPSGSLNANDAWDWNNAVYHRSYWAMSPAYFTSDYPEVSSDVLNKNGQGVESAGMHYNQMYYSYNQLTGTDPMGYTPSATTSQYFHETTVGAKALTSKNPVAAVPSIVLVGTYTISVNGTEAAPGTTFYTYLPGATTGTNPLVFFEANAESNIGASAVPGGESMLRRFIEQTSILFKKEGGDYKEYTTSDADMKTLVAALEVSEPASGTLGDVKLAERFRTLQFKASANTEGIYLATAEGYKAITTNETASTGEVTLQYANQALMQQVGYCVKYNTGAGYFNIPVKHYGWYRNGNENKGAESVDWAKVRVGDFGVVRNHSYNVEVDKITGLATGIGGLDNPIVPPAGSKEYYIAYKVNILKWAVVPTQQVQL